MNRVVAIAMAFSLVLQGPAAFAQSEGKYEKTKTPIKHLVIIFDENISFDHYFGTYPNALNPRENRSSSPLPIRPRSMGSPLNCCTTIPT